MRWRRKRAKVGQKEAETLISSIDRARSRYRGMKQWRMVNDDAGPCLPVMLVEVQYRYMLAQARKRGISNRWYLHMR